MVLSDTISYITILGLTIVFTAFALAIQDKYWKVILKFTAGLFWFIMAIAEFFYFGAGGFLMILSLPYAIIGIIFIFAIIRDFLNVKHDRIYNFED